MKTKSKVILIIVGVVVAGLIIGPYLLAKRAKSPDLEFFIAEKSTLIKEINVTGKVKPAQNVDLAFENSGKVSAIFVKIGDYVEIGQKLISQDSSQLQAQLEQYQAAYLKDLANLNELKSGARPEEIEISQIKVNNAQSALNNGKINLANVENKAKIDLGSHYDDVENILQDSYAATDEAVNDTLDALFNNDNTDSPELTFSTTDSSLEREVLLGRVSVRNSLDDFKNELDSLTANQPALDSALSNTQNRLADIIDFLNKLAQLLNKGVGSNINTYKGYLNTARTSVSAQLSTINTQKQDIAAQKAINQNNISAAQTSLNEAENALDLAQQELILKQAGPTKEQLNAQEAQVRLAQANIANTQAQLAKTIIYSPINGVVSKQNGKIGEIVSANGKLVSIISEADFEIETFVPEVDIADLAVGQSAQITLDAYEETEIFKAKVIAVEPAETVIEGVAAYKTILQFEKEDGRIKSGMTANINILTAEKENVLAVPFRALVTQNGGRFVRLLIEDEIVEQPVQTGLRGSDGNIEIISGIEEGDQVVTFLEAGK